VVDTRKGEEWEWKEEFGKESEAQTQEDPY
jgi:hypothetical protein